MSQSMYVKAVEPKPGNFLVGVAIVENGIRLLNKLTIQQEIEEAVQLKTQLQTMV